MKDLYGWFIPDWDTHYKPMMRDYDGKWEYQKEQRDYALSFVKNYNLALDIGGNIGFWSIDLCNKFKNVWAFEPHPDNIECYRKNLSNYNNFQLEEIALSNKEQENAVLFSSPDECGNVSLNAHGVQTGTSLRTLEETQLNKTYTDVKKLDSYLEQFKNTNIDFIKVDCQEHEREIVEGGLELIKQHDTVLCLELPRRNNDEKIYHDKLVDLLSSIGYKRRGNMRKETLFTR
jgi:FkbM family methyltransferase